MYNISSLMYNTISIDSYSLYGTLDSRNITSSMIARLQLHLHAA